MPQEAQVPEIVARVGELLEAMGGQGPDLRLTGKRFDDGWLYLVAEPTRAGQRASEYARLMTEIERRLLAEGYDQVLMVPALPEHQGLIDVP